MILSAEISLLVVFLIFIFRRFSHLSGTYVMGYR